MHVANQPRARPPARRDRSRRSAGTARARRARIATHAPGTPGRAGAPERARRYGLILTGPLTVLPVACTEPVSGGGSVPVVPEMVSGPLIWLLLNSTPPRLFVRLTGPEIVLPAHGPVAASPPTRTSPVLPETDSGPDSRAPAKAHHGRVGRADRPRHDRAVEVDRAAGLDRDWPVQPGAGLGAERLAGRDRERAVARPGQTRGGGTDAERVRDERAEAVVRRGQAADRARNRVVAGRAERDCGRRARRRPRDVGGRGRLTEHEARERCRQRRVRRAEEP